MEYKILNTGSYLLIVDDSKIKYNDWYYSYLSETIGQAAPNALDNPNLKKVISHLPLNNSPILEGVDLLPDLPQFEDDIYDTNIQVVGSDKVTTIKEFLKKHNKEVKEYTEKDLRKAFKYGIEMEAGIESFDYKNYPDGFSQFIDSLNKQD